MPRKNRKRKDILLENKPLDEEVPDVNLGNLFVLLYDIAEDIDKNSDEGYLKEIFNSKDK